MQDFEEAEEMEMNNNSATNDRKSDDDLFQNNLSQESKHSRKSVVTAHRNTSGREKKVKKFNFKKGARAKFRREFLHHILTHHKWKVGMEDYGNSRKFHGTVTSGNGKSGRNYSFDDSLANHKEERVKSRTTLSVADHEEEEKEQDHVTEECNKIEDEESNIQLKMHR